MNTSSFFWLLLLLASASRSRANQNAYNYNQQQYNNNNNNNAQQNNYDGQQQNQYNYNNNQQNNDDGYYEENAYNYNNYNNGGNDDGGNAAQQQEEEEEEDAQDFYYDDYIDYWTDYEILPKRCVVYNNVDVIVYQIFDSIHHCSTTPVGTYVTPVPYFIQGHLKETAQKMQDRGVDDYVSPDVAEYTYCTPYEIQGKYYFMKLGCADDSTTALAVNIYQDEDCTKRSLVDGYDDATIDVSSIDIGFKKCQSCVNWMSFEDDEIDDQFYENRQKNAPLCSTAWAKKEECGNKCQRIGLKDEKEGWNAADKLLLTILSVFGLVLVGLIAHKRQKMSNKDALLEQAAMNAAGLQTPHVIAVFILVVLVIAVFAALGLKNVTWALLLGINFALFAYLMKLTFDSSVNSGETVIGPDGQILRKDSDDSSIEDASREGSRRQNAGTYMLPTLT